MPRLEYNYNKNILELITSGDGITHEDVVFNPDTDYIRMAVFNEYGTFIESFYSNIPDDGLVPFYEEENFYVKPNDVLAQKENLFGQGNYKLRFDFLNNPFSEFKWLITEISPSRKEIRLSPKNIDNTIHDIDFIDFDCKLKNESVDCPDKDYKFDFIVGLSKYEQATIVNYDLDPRDETFVIRLDKPIHSKFASLTEVTVEREVIATQIEDIFYIAEFVDEFGSTVGLEDIRINVPADSLVGGIDDLDLYNDEEDSFQTFDDITASGSLITDSMTQFILSGSDVNLNIDYSKFENHVVFGSAKSKLENFKRKASQIEDYLVNISSSLVTCGSLSVYSYRDDLFSKIQDQIKSFVRSKRINLILYF